MTDRIGIDEQIAAAEALGGDRGNAILATLRDWKRIQEAKVPEPVAWMQSDRLNKLVMKHCGSQSMLVRVSDHKLQSDYQPLYGPEVLDLLRRETAKNERIMELLREPSNGLVTDCARRLLQWQDNSTDESFDKLTWAGARTDARRVIAEFYALLAEVEKETDRA